MLSYYQKVGIDNMARKSKELAYILEIFKEDEIRKLLQSGFDPYSAVEKLWGNR